MARFKPVCIASSIFSLNPVCLKTKCADPEKGVQVSVYPPLKIIKLKVFLVILVRIPCTPTSNLGYLAPLPPGQFFMGAKLFIGVP